MRMKIDFNKFYDYIIAIAVIINTSSQYLYIKEFGNLFAYISLLLLLIGTIGSLSIGKLKTAVVKKALVYSAFFLFYALLYLIVRPVNINGYIGFVIAFILIYIYFKCKLHKLGMQYDIFRCYINLITIITFVSVIFWILTTLININIPYQVYHTTWTGDIHSSLPIKSYFLIYFKNQPIDLFSKYIIDRNVAIFSEAPMASLNFSVALLLELFTNRYPRKKVIVILIIGIITSFSTTGLIITIVALTGKYFVSNKIKGKMKIIKYLLLPVFLIIAIILIDYLIQQKVGTLSGNLRIDDYMIGFQAWKANFILGAGFNNNSIITEFIGNGRVSQGYSNTVLNILYLGGIYWGILYYTPIVKGVYYSVKLKNTEMLIFIMCFILLLASTVFTYQYLLIFILLFISTQSNYRLDVKSEKKSTRKAYSLKME